MADSVATRQSRPQRAASKKRRQATVSTETENKLARAARSAQRLAQLSGASRDDSTLDLFPDDPTRATLEAMNIDIRQGTLHGFELPDVVLAAVGAIDAGDGVLLDAKAARRTPRVARTDEPVPVNAQLSGLEIELSTPAALPVGEKTVPADAKPAAQAYVHETPTVSARDLAMPFTSAMAAATVARSMTALRQAEEPRTAAADPAAASKSGGGKPPQRFAATLAKAATASQDAAVADVEAASRVADSATVDMSGASTESTDAAAKRLTDTAEASPDAGAAAFAAPWREAQRAESAAAALRAAPELDRARATAFADTVDALYGVIADQRRAATDHSRRMKWMLSIVVGALLVTVAIGITQTLLLMRLTRETTAQQHRIEMMMQTQQAAMASLLDSHIAVANAAAANAAATAVTTPPAAPQQAGAATTAHGKHAARTLHGYRAKAVRPG
ncbi:hypothetical protein [Paraburkholderia fynbosensis]|uniref:Cell wall surface anchor family protein n=1 Tax=Paraburkholderia fynbosensis TaxID=1200993 RepID=A0A6J5GHD0_9BURK|nr:hypothetical protein [Paraburkholderia fynbosensis]CAB3800916.1 hypothetical protein LMG27177_04914 [Paraburkholderia fynbosensis]